MSFFQSLYDSTFYFNDQDICIAIYVNDLHIVRPDIFLINELKVKLAAKLTIIDLGPIAHYLEMKVFQDNNIITVKETIDIYQLFATH